MPKHTGQHGAEAVQRSADEALAKEQAKYGCHPGDVASPQQSEELPADEDSGEGLFPGTMNRQFE